MRLAAAIDAFVSHVRDERGLSRHTVAAYESDLRLMEGYLSDGGRTVLDLDGLSPLHLKDLVAHLRDDRQFKPRSLARVMSTLRVFFDHWTRAGELAASPAEGLHNPKIPKKLPVYLVDEEMTRLLRAPDRADPIGFRDYAVLMTFLFTGIRLSELAGLNVEDADLTAGTLLVRGKGSKERLLPVHADLAACLRSYLESGRPRFTDTARGALFLNHKGERVTARAVGWLVGRAVKRAGVSHRITPHKLRHTFATQLLAEGAALLEIKDLLGHSQLATTAIYTHTNVDRLRRAVEKIDL